jgi:hypothetical protein
MISDSSTDAPRDIYLAAAESVRGLVERIPSDAWDGPGLGVWDLRALVGHTSRSLATVLHYLSRPADIIEIPSSADYYVAIKNLAGATVGDVAERGRQAGRELGASPARRFGALYDEVVTALDGVDDPVITCIAGAIRLSDYLPTRTFELVVHGGDIADATSLRFDPPRAALESSAVLGAQVAVRLGAGAVLLRAITGRAALPAAFTVV